MQNSNHFEYDWAESIEAVGGEALAGSGFETEEPEPGFSVAEMEAVE